MDLTQLSDDDLKRLYNNDYSGISDEAKQSLNTQTQQIVEQQQQQQAQQQAQIQAQQGPGDWAMQNVVAPVTGAATTAGNLIAGHPLIAAGAAGAWKANKMANAWQSAAAQRAAAEQLTANTDLYRSLMSNQTKADAEIRQLIKKHPDAASRPADVIRQIETLEQRSANLGNQITEAGKAIKPITPTEQPSIIQRGMDIASKMRQFAAERVIPSMGQAARSAINPVTVGIGSMLYSPSTGPDVPQSGPYKGMELNPRTRRPWTPQELAQYR